MFGKLFKSDKQTEFWKWFTKNQEAIFHFEDNQETIFNQLSEKLKDINNNLTFEFSPIKDNGTREFCISADGIKASFPDVIALVEKAPALPGWEIYAFRQRVPGDALKINMAGTELGYADIFLRYGEEDDKIGVELNIRNYDRENNTIKGAVFILLDSLLGEYDMETYISWIDFVPLNESNIENLYPLTYLRDLVDLAKV
ncbi:MAG TPA: hypothetical protein VIM55_16150 [Mucilaginibacter sp.]